MIRDFPRKAKKQPGFWDVGWVKNPVSWTKNLILAVFFSIFPTENLLLVLLPFSPLRPREKFPPLPLFYLKQMSAPYFISALKLPPKTPGPGYLEGFDPSLNKTNNCK